MCSWYLYLLLCDYNILALIVTYKVLQNIYLRSLPFTLKVSRRSTLILKLGYVHPSLRLKYTSKNLILNTLQKVQRT